MMIPNEKRKFRAESTNLDEFLWRPVIVNVSTNNMLLVICYIAMDNGPMIYLSFFHGYAKWPDNIS